MRLQDMQARWPDNSKKTYFQKRRKPAYYGSNYQVKPWFNRLLDSHGPRIGAAICFLSACLVISFCYLMFIKVAPVAIDGLVEHSRQVVEESRR